MADADVDGSHICTLMLTFFFRYMRPLIDHGYVYVAQPPLFKLQKGQTVKYAYNDDEMKLLSAEMPGAKVNRYKGLGEMNPDQLWETTMNPDNRVIVQIKIEDAERADEAFSILMGEQVEPRRQFIEKKFVYDFVATITTQKGALPDVDRCYETRKGICQDLAAVTACMLRVQGIPAKMSVGHADSMYHAWVSVWLDGQWQRYDPTAGVHGVAEAKNYTEEKCY